MQQFLVKNIGNAVTDDFVEVGFWINGTKDTNWWNDDHGALAPGESAVLRMETLYSANTVGDLLIEAFVDDLDRFEESNEDNNKKQIVVSIEDSSFQYQEIEAENFTSASTGIRKLDGYIGYFDAGRYIKYSDINFGNGAKSISFQIADGDNGGKFSIRIGSSAGTILANVTPIYTNSWSAFQTQKINIAETSGIHDLYIVGEDDYGI